MCFLSSPSLDPLDSTPIGPLTIGVANRKRPSCLESRPKLEGEAVSRKQEKTTLDPEPRPPDPVLREFLDELAELIADIILEDRANGKRS